MSEGNYFPVDIRIFRTPLKDIQFDVFLKLSEGNYAHVFSKSTGIDYKRLAQYIHKGTTHLFIKHEDEALFKAYLSRSPEEVFEDPDTSEIKKVSLLLNMAEQNMAEFFNVIDVSNDIAVTSVKIIKGFIKILSSEPKTLSVLLKTASHGEYLYYHSISTAIISMYLAKASGNPSAKMLEICSLGGFLHDIGHTKLPKDVCESPVDLSPSQWREMRLHPKLGLRMIEGTPNIPDEIRYIILQHHEEPSGNGYPNNLRGPVIFYPAKVVSLADAFCALITRRPFREAYTVKQALHIIQSEAGKFDTDLVRILSDLFGEKRKAA